MHPLPLPRRSGAQHHDSEPQFARKIDPRGLRNNSPNNMHSHLACLNPKGIPKITRELILKWNQEGVGTKRPWKLTC